MEFNLIQGKFMCNGIDMSQYAILLQNDYEDGDGNESHVGVVSE